MKPHLLSYCLIPLLTLATIGWAHKAPAAQAHDGTPMPKAVLVELFTSEGCSSCPPADELLKQVSGRQTVGGPLVIGLSEHVSYWNGLGWRDPFSAEVFTTRQNEYRSRFGENSVYTPQMVVNGREHFVGSDRRALEAALAVEARHEQINLHIISSETREGAVRFSYSASGLPEKGSFQLIAVLVDDIDSSMVLRGENTGRQLQHISVARALAPLGPLRDVENKSMTLPLPATFPAKVGGHHLVLFAQQRDAGAIIGVDTKPL